MKQNLKNLTKNLPRRAWASLILVGILTGPVIYIQTILSDHRSHAPNEDAVKQQETVSPPSATVILALHSDEDSTPEPIMLASFNSRPTATPTPFFIFHTVKRKETLISIASKYGVTSEQLLASNDIRDPNSLEVGKQLLIPPEDTLYKGKLVPHTVKAGETLLGVASKYGSSVKAIQVANRLHASDELAVDDSIVVPVLFNQANTVSSALKDEVETEYHTVQSGETPLEIAINYDVPVDVLISVNNIADPTKLQVGQQLLIPINEDLSYSFPVILYELEEHDTLVGIASRFGSSVKDILSVNPDLDPADTQVGQLVAIPVVFAPELRPDPVDSPVTPPTPLPPPPALVQLQQELIDLVNAKRETHNLAPYTTTGALSEVALAHAQDMVVRDYMAHTTPDGRSPKDRLIDHGITDAFRIGENIQRNTRPRGKTVEQAVNWFMNSTVHRNSLLNPHYNQIGVSVVEGPPGWYTYVIVFVER